MTDLPGLLRALDGAGVEFIIVGGVAATVHGSAGLTQDLDVVYRRTPGTLPRVVEALRGHAPYLRGAPPGLPFRWDVDTVARGLNFTLETSLGPIDLLGEIVGGGTYDALMAHTLEVELFDVKCRCLDLPTLIRVKRAAGRPRDLDAVAELERLLEERG